MTRWLVAILSVLVGASALSQALAQCPDIETYVGEVTVAEFGTALFGNFRSNSLRGTIEFYDGVCLTDAENGWAIISDEMLVLGVQDEQETEIRIPESKMIIGDWVIESQETQSLGADLMFTTASFVGPKFSGIASQIQMKLEVFQAWFTEVNIVGEQFAAEGDSALLDGEKFTIFHGTATTCIGEGEPFYKFRGTGVDLDLNTGEILLRNGLFQTGGISLPLGEAIELNEAALAELIPDIEFNYGSVDSKPGEVESGFEVTASEIRLSPGIDISLGLGSYGKKPKLLGYGNVSLKTAVVDAEFGLTREGPRFDFLLEEEIFQGLDGRLHIRNHHQANSDYLHEGVLGLEATLLDKEWNKGLAVSLNLNGFGATSSQMLNSGVVVGVRLGAGLEGIVKSPVTSIGYFLFKGGFEATSYPTLGSAQFGLFAEPTWVLRFGPTESQFRYTRVHTNAESPFSEALDRLANTNKIDFLTSVQGKLPRDAEGDFSLQLTYDFLAPGQDALELEAEAGIRFNVNRMSFIGKAWVGTISGDEAHRNALRVGGSAGLKREKLDVGVWADYEFREHQSRWEELGVQVALPIAYRDLVVTPFAAVNLTAAITGNEKPTVLGHGVSVEWFTCCGDLTAGYRYERYDFSIILGFRL